MNVQLPWWKVIALGFCAWLVFAGPKGCALPVFGPVGPQTILIAYEEGRATTAFADLIVDFQNGEAGKPFKAKGHNVLFLDNDTPDISGNLAAPLKPFAPFDDNKPELVVSSGDKLTFREPLTYSTSAEALAAILKAKGLP